MTGSAQFTSTHLIETIGTEDFFPTVQAVVEWWCDSCGSGTA
jgi:hypothetical protein